MFDYSGANKAIVVSVDIVVFNTLTYASVRHCGRIASGVLSLGCDCHPQIPTARGNACYSCARDLPIEREIGGRHVAWRNPRL
jgi:hypothetical protein